MAEDRQRIVFDFWACQRPLTHRWGSGQVFNRIAMRFGRPDIVFGVTDGIPHDVPTVDKDAQVNPTYVADWANLSFGDNQFKFGYWDPPYDKLHKKEGQEIWRCCQRLAILHTHIWPRAWLNVVCEAVREAMIAVTMGPMKRIRCLQIFRKRLN